MLSLLTFIGVALLLVIEGTSIALLILPRGSRRLALALSLPVAALMNVLMTFDSTILGIPLSPPFLIGEHALIALIAAIAVWKQRLWFSLPSPSGRGAGGEGARAHIATYSALILIGFNIIYSFSHAILLPSNQYDSATNWTMRSEISFYDQKIAFDADEARGMAKPQYPFLFHALQITANQGQNLGVAPRNEAGWSDTAANAILYLLSVCTFWAIFEIVSRMRGSVHALITLALLTGIPILGLHLAQGYGDINLVQYLLLSLVLLASWIESRKSGELLMSGIFVAAAVWTKSEGSVFGFLPWLIGVAAVCLVEKGRWKEIIAPVVIAILLAIPWPIFAWIKGLSLTPHSTDTMIGFRSEGLSEAILGLFSRGSFGIDWYALCVAIPLILFFSWKKNPATEPRQRVLLLIGAVVFAEIIFVYLFTPNVRFLMNAESYYRQMMLPCAMLVLGCSLCIRKPDGRVATSV